MKIIDDGRFGCPPNSQDLLPCNFAFFPKSKAEWKGKHLNDLDELRLKSTNILCAYPLDWFDEVYIVSGSSDLASALCHIITKTRPCNTQLFSLHCFTIFIFLLKT